MDFVAFKINYVAIFVVGLNADFHGFVFLFDYQLGATLWLCITDLH